MSTKRKPSSWVYGLILGSTISLLAFLGQLMNGVTGPDLICHPLTNIVIYTIIFTGIISLIRRVISNGKARSEQSRGHSELHDDIIADNENEKIRSEIYVDFYSQNSTSIKVNINKENSRLFFEVALFCFYTIRQLANLKGSGADKALADALLNAQDKDLLFFDLGDYIQASDVSVIVPKLVSYAGRGNKSFITSLTITNFPNNPHFSMLLDTKGFGLLGSEINYYAIQSVNALTRYFANKYANNDDYLKVFAKAAYLCGKRFNDIGSPIHQNSIVIEILKAIPLLDQSGSVLSDFDGLTSKDLRINYDDDTVEKTDLPTTQSAINEAVSIKQTQSNYDIPADDYVVCWECSATNRSNETYCQKCGVALDEKFKQPEPTSGLLWVFFKAGLIFSIILLVVIVSANYFSNLVSSSNKAANLPPPTIMPPPTIKPTKKPTLIPTKNPNVLFSDDFSIRDLGKESSSDDIKMWYGNDDGDSSFFISIGKPNTYSWLNIPITVSDVIIETNGYLIGNSNDAAFGVVCRASESGNYYFLINGDGYYDIGKSINGISNSIQYGRASNFTWDKEITSVVGECIGSKLRLRVNGELLLEVEDISLVSGSVGLLAAAGSSGINTAKFLDVLVTKPINSSKSKIPSPSNCIPWDKVTFEDDGKYLCITGNPIRVDYPHPPEWDEEKNKPIGDYFRGAVYFDAGWGKLILEGFSTDYIIKKGECVQVQGYIYTSSSHPMINLNAKDTLISSCQ